MKSRILLFLLFAFGSQILFAAADYEKMRLANPIVQQVQNKHDGHDYTKNQWWLKIKAFFSKKSSSHRKAPTRSRNNKFGATAIWLLLLAIPISFNLPLIALTLVLFSMASALVGLLKDKSPRLAKIALFSILGVVVILAVFIIWFSIWCSKNCD